MTRCNIFGFSDFFGVQVIAMALACTFVLASSVRADLVEFALQGSAGGGVTAANEPGDTGIGSGDLLAISVYDTDTNMLSLNVAWGSGNGFTDFSSNASLVNLHFVENGLPPDVFQQSGSAFVTLDGVDESSTSGGFNGMVLIPEAREGDLLVGRVYLHIHTDNLGGGEARGYFISQTVVPEPGSVTLLGFAVAGLFVRRRRTAC